MRSTIELAREANEYADANWALWPTSNRWKKIRDERFAELVRADEREQIKDEWWMCVQSDLENGVKSLNEQAATKWRKEYPEIAKFGAWLTERGERT